MVVHCSCLPPAPAVPTFATIWSSIRHKYDPEANELWTYDFGPQNRWTWAFDLGLEADDDIFVAGQNTQVDAQADPDMFLLKLSP